MLIAGPTFHQNPRSLWGHQIHEWHARFWNMHWYCSLVCWQIVSESSNIGSISNQRKNPFSVPRIVGNLLSSATCSLMFIICTSPLPISKVDVFCPFPPMIFLDIETVSAGCHQGIWTVGAVRSIEASTAWPLDLGPWRVGIVQTSGIRKLYAGMIRRSTLTIASQKRHRTKPEEHWNPSNEISINHACHPW